MSKILCKECGTTEKEDVINEEDIKGDYGYIIKHKKGCSFIKRLIKEGFEI